MAQPEMNSFQLSAFWVWYHSAQNGSHHERSYEATAKRLAISHKVISHWAKEFGWHELARDEDQKLNREFEGIIKTEIIDTFEDAIRRQKELLSEIYAMFLGAIRGGQIELKIADLVKLMELEAQSIYGRGDRAAQANLLTVVLQTMPPEKRTEFYGHIERARDAGILSGTGMGSPGRN
jgi:hypothetical protein